MVTIADASKVLGVSRQTIMAWLDAGKFPGAEKGEGQTKPWLIPVGDVEKVRLEIVTDLEERLSRVARPTSTYRFDLIARHAIV